MYAGVSKSGSPISRWITDFPWASSARARASTSNAVSVPRRDMRAERSMRPPSKRHQAPGSGGGAIVFSGGSASGEAGGPVYRQTDLVGTAERGGRADPDEPWPEPERGARGAHQLEAGPRGG